VVGRFFVEDFFIFFSLYAELSTSSGRNGTNGGAASSPSSGKVDVKTKLNLVELVAPVSDDLQLLNDNLQKVSTSIRRSVFFPHFPLCRSLYLVGMQFFGFTSGGV
jgi:hypothetical protein